MNAEEVNFDGMVGPTHHYGGYALGNIASIEHQKQISYPKQAALQGLKKMKRVADLGISQAVLPPRLRPAFHILRSLGFQGSEVEMFQACARHSPSLLYALSSSSSMWAANCATVAPSCDTADGRLHLTVANLQSHFHRSIEAEEGYRLLCLLFPDESHFAIHPPLIKGGAFGDEGAANHTRFCSAYGEKGVHLFTYATSAFETKKREVPFRQAKETSEAVARLHGLENKRTFFIQQNPAAIEAGVFHNDVIAVGNRSLFLYHEKAYVEAEAIFERIESVCPLKKICVTEKMLSLKQAVRSYLFNSQLLTLPNGEDLLLAPEECSTLTLDWLPMRVAFVDVGQSMQNGGGPACLRLRCVLSEEEKKRVHPFVFLTDSLYQRLTKWVHKYYRDQLSYSDLQDPALVPEVLEALDALTQILHLGSFYEFQQTPRHSP